jgi:DNA invertase Pin-like site-specific DNA recombinase
MPHPPGPAPEPSAGTVLGYARVSTAEQHLDLQVDALMAAGCYRVFADTASDAAARWPLRAGPRP